MFILFLPLGALNAKVPFDLVPVVLFFDDLNVIGVALLDDLIIHPPPHAALER
jgi:hypothetical protein